MAKKQNFQSWLATFAEEKQLDMSEFVQGKECMLQVGDVLSAMNSTTSEEQAQIKNTLVMIDFKNGDVMHYVKHLAQALGPEYKMGI